MNEIEKIKKLKEIKPDEAFVLKTRLLILQKDFKKTYRVLYLKYFALSFVVLIVFIFSFYFIKFQNYKTLVFDLENEFKNFEIEKQLEDLTLRKEINSSIELTLNYIKNEKYNFDEKRIQQEIEKINEIKSLNDKSKEINVLLDLIIN